jgi:hypothetical protein
MLHHPKVWCRAGWCLSTQVTTVFVSVESNLLFPKHPWKCPRIAASLVGSQGVSSARRVRLHSDRSLSDIRHCAIDQKQSGRDVASRIPPATSMLLLLSASNRKGLEHARPAQPPTDPLIQVYKYNADTFVLRVTKCFSFEASTCCSATVRPCCSTPADCRARTTPSITAKRFLSGRR